MKKGYGLHIFNILKSKKFFSRNFSLVFCMIAILIGVNSILLSSMLIKSMSDKISLKIESQLTHMSSLTDYIINSAEGVLLSLQSDNDVYFLMNSTPEKVYYSDIDKLTKKINSFILSNDCLDSVIIKCHNTNKVISSSLIEEWFTTKEITKDEIMIYPQIKYNKFPPVITICKPFFDAKKEICLGYIAVNIDCLELNRKLISNNSEKVEFAMSINNSIIYSTDYNNIEKNSDSLYRKSTVFNNTTYYTTPSQYHEIQYALVDRNNYTTEIFKNSITYIFFCFIIIFVAGIIVSFILSKKIYAPFEHIVSMLKNINNSEPLSEYLSDLELIENQIISYHKQNEYLTEQLTLQTSKVEQATLNALQAQINPHFLFNTIENIRWCSLTNNTDKTVSDSLYSLSVILKTSYDFKSLLINIEDEIVFLQHYIDILRFRFKNAFDVEWSLSDDIKDKKILKMLLQPVIENAFIHGIRPTEKHGIIKIHGDIENDCIVFKIIDNGQGMSDAKMKHINQMLSNPEKPSDFTGVGLKNVAQRIKLLFADSGYIRFSKRQDGENGICVTISLPLFKNKDYFN